MLHTFHLRHHCDLCMTRRPPIYLTILGWNCTKTHLLHVCNHTSAWQSRLHPALVQLSLVKEPDLLV